MYLDYWDLSESPFTGIVTSKRFYVSSAAEEAVSRLDYLVEERRRVGLLAGEPGSGKTTLLARFAEQQRRDWAQVARLNLTGLSADEFSWSLARELGLSLAQEMNQPHLWRAISDRLAEFRYQQRAVVVLLDDAHSTSTEVVRQMLRLIRLDPNTAAPVTTVLATDAGRVQQVPAEMLQVAELRIDLDGWTQDEVADYLATSMQQAGSSADVFHPAAVERLFELTGGLPRQVNQLADLALLAAAGEQLAQIEATTVEAVHGELLVSNA